MKKTVIFITIFLFIAMYGCESGGGSDTTASSNGTDNEKGDKPTLTLGITPWTSTVPATEIVKIVLKDMGYEVEGTEADLGVTMAGLSKGDVDIFMDYWDPQHKPYLDEFSDSIDVVSTSYDDAARGIAVPKYMEDVNDVDDLKGKEDIVNNEVLAIEESDPTVEEIPKLIDIYDLDMEMTNSSEAAMLAAAKSKIEKEEPVVLFGWRPHSMFHLLDIKLLTNKNAPEVLTPSTIHVLANQELKDNAPEAYAFLRNWRIPIDDIEDMIIKIDNGENPEEVAQDWIDDNQDKIDEMKNDN
ncbi:glycine betaine ABC transporter substrate-binding protein [Virgibacillus sp. NKC19-3]|uniref:glycine betaine ABC transporter substrate-binding protein n=1 Tax=Virgibacillus saliphilus TaxID=2831674 RepID=UPI001C9AD37D|nr:glycine betaine ABC transporter substrate-binding protein [Virgibacillus sp. NKC19-3]MBY7142421.1 glycine betaine ABC transporter substrate-binding protein [Virgibacillus sp. NKC19-3]